MKHANAFLALPLLLTAGLAAAHPGHEHTSLTSDLLHQADVLSPALILLVLALWLLLRPGAMQSLRRVFARITRRR